MLICLNGTEYVYAQWTKKDSLWLQNVESGKEKLKLNPETMKAIESGSLINLGLPDGLNHPDNPAANMQLKASSLPILKDFSEYVQADSTRRKVALKDLPVSVFKLYQPKYTPELRSYILIRDAIRKESPYYPRFTAIDVGKMTSRKEYVHKRNARRDGTWQNYNNLPTPDIIKKKKTLRSYQEKLAVQDSILKADSIAQIDTTRIVIPELN